MALDFFDGGTLDASTADFVVSILVWSDDAKTHLQPPLMLGTHSLPWHSAADDQYHGPFDMLCVVVEECGAPIGCTLCASSVFPSCWCGTLPTLSPTLAAMAFTVTRRSWVMSPSTSWTMSSVMRCGVPDRASSANNTRPSLKRLCHTLTLQGICSAHRTLLTFFNEYPFPYSFHC